MTAPGAGRAVASLPMYDLPELRAATDAWWRGIARHLRAAGLETAPPALSRPEDLVAHWRARDLVLSQTCGFPMTHALAGAVTYVATPHYDAPGCSGPHYRSRIVVRAEVAAGDASLAGFRGTRLAYNDPDSQSGLNALRATLAASKAVADSPETPFFAAAIETGGHRASLAAVREGRADLCAVDAVTYALIGDVAPEELAGLATLDWTEGAPGLPLITAGGASAATVAALRAALETAMTDPELADARAALRLSGLSVLAPDAYDAIPAMRRRADSVPGLGLSQSRH